MTPKEYRKELKKISKPFLPLGARLMNLGLTEITANLLKYFAYLTQNDSIKQKSEELTTQNKFLKFYTNTYLPLSHALSFIIAKRNIIYPNEKLTKENINLTNSPSISTFKLLKIFPQEYIFKILSYFCSETESKDLMHHLSQDDEQSFNVYTTEHHININDIQRLCAHYIEKQQYAEYVETYSNEDRTKIIVDFYTRDKEYDADLKIPEVFFDDEPTTENLQAMQEEMPSPQQILNQYEFILIKYLSNKNELTPLERKILDRIIRRKRNREWNKQAYEGYEEIQNAKVKELDNRMPDRPIHFKNSAKLYEMITKLADSNYNFIDNNHIKHLYYFCKGEGNKPTDSDSKISWNGSAASLKFFFLQLYTDDKKQMPAGSWKIIASNFLVHSRGHKTEVSYSYLTSGLDPQKLPTKMKNGEQEKILAITTPFT